MYIATVFFFLYVGVSNETHACLCKWLKFVPLSSSLST
jgi:hypothetical protein